MRPKSSTCRGVSSARPASASDAERSQVRIHLQEFRRYGGLQILSVFIGQGLFQDEAVVNRLPLLGHHPVTPLHNGAKDLVHCLLDLDHLLLQQALKFGRQIRSDGQH